MHLVVMEVSGDCILYDFMFCGQCRWALLRAWDLIIITRVRWCGEVKKYIHIYVLIYSSRDQFCHRLRRYTQQIIIHPRVSCAIPQGRASIADVIADINYVIADTNCVGNARIINRSQQ